MTKQEEIREGIFDIIRPYFIMHSDAVSISYKIRNYLHSQGVVIKVERELPEYPLDGTVMSNKKIEAFNQAYKKVYDEAQQVMLRYIDECFKPIGTE